MLSILNVNTRKSFRIILLPHIVAVSLLESHSYKKMGGGGSNTGFSLCGAGRNQAHRLKSVLPIALAITRPAPSAPQLTPLFSTLSCKPSTISAPCNSIKFNHIQTSRKSAPAKSFRLIAFQKKGVEVGGVPQGSAAPPHGGAEHKSCGSRVGFCPGSLPAGDVADWFALSGLHAGESNDLSGRVNGNKTVSFVDPVDAYDRLALCAHRWRVKQRGAQPEADRGDKNSLPGRFQGIHFEVSFVESAVGHIYRRESSLYTQANTEIVPINRSRWRSEWRSAGTQEGEQSPARGLIWSAAIAFIGADREGQRHARRGTRAILKVEPESEKRPRTERLRTQRRQESLGRSWREGRYSRQPTKFASSFGGSKTESFRMFPRTLHSASSIATRDSARWRSGRNASGVSRAPRMN